MDDTAAGTGTGTGDWTADPAAVARVGELARRVGRLVHGTPLDEGIAALGVVLVGTLVKRGDRLSRLRAFIDTAGHALAGRPVTAGEPEALLTIAIGLAGRELMARGSLTTGGHSSWHALAEANPDMFERIERMLHQLVDERLADLRKQAATSTRALAAATEAEAGHA